MTTTAGTAPATTSPELQKDSIIHLEFVDALRGLAVLGVILFHSAEFLQGQLPRVVEAVTSRGSLGVPLFYMASAFTLFLSMEQRRRKDRLPTTAFFVRRFFRIAPLFYLMIPLYLYLDGTGPRYSAPYGVHPWQVITTCLFVQGWHPESINSVVPGGWSVAIEMTFYLLLPFLFVVITNVRRAMAFLAIAIAIRVFMNVVIGPHILAAYPPENQYIAVQFLDFWLPAQLHTFACGIVFYFVFQRVCANRRRPALGYACLAAMVLSIPLAILGGRLAADATLFLLALSLGAYPTKLLVNPVTEYVGKISYSLYLLNFAAIELAIRLVDVRRISSVTLRLVVLFSLVLLMATVMGTITFYGVEEPGRKLGKAVLERIQGRSVRPKVDRPEALNPGL